MILLGVLVNPIPFCDLLRERGEKFSVNKLEDGKPIAIFTSFSKFVLMRLTFIPKRVIIFDAVERLSSLDSIKIIDCTSLRKAYNAAIGYTKTVEKVQLVPRDYIRETIEQNKDLGFLHEYNTNLYAISFKYTRDDVKKVFLDYLLGETSKSKFHEEIAKIHPKRGKSKEAVTNLIAITEKPMFADLKRAIKEARGKSKQEIEKIAQKNGVEAYDLHYILSTISVKKRNK